MEEGRAAARLSEFARKQNLTEAAETELREIVQAAMLEACLGSLWRMRKRRQRLSSLPEPLSS
jgi:hypothetical protein